MAGSVKDKGAKGGGRAVDDGAKARKAGAPEAGSGDSPKRQGDKLGKSGAAKATASAKGRTGDSPKRQGDKLEKATRAAAGKGRGG